MNAKKRLWAMLLIAVIFSVTSMPAFAQQMDFEALLSNMPVVPGSPADLDRQQSQLSSSIPESSAAPEFSAAPVSSQPAAVSRPAVTPQAPVASQPQVPSSALDASAVESAGLSSTPSRRPSSSSGTISLPSPGEVSEVGELIASGTEVTPERGLNWIGIASWICIVLGVIVVVAVLFSTVRRPPRGGSGRKRYRRKPYRSNRKRLLNDKYYRDYRY